MIIMADVLDIMMYWTKPSFISLLSHLLLLYE